MNMGGLGERFALLKMQKPTQRCERCGLRYVVEENDKCPHCGTLSNFELGALKERISMEQEGNRRLGQWFILIAVCVLVFTVVVTGL